MTEKRKTFMEGLGETAAENLFKVLITAGTVLAGIWQDVLVPAGKQLGEILSDIGASLGRRLDWPGRGVFRGAGDCRGGSGDCPEGHSASCSRRSGCCCLRYSVRSAWC